MNNNLSTEDYDLLRALELLGYNTLPDTGLKLELGQNYLRVTYPHFWWFERAKRISLKNLRQTVHILCSNNNILCKFYMTSVNNKPMYHLDYGFDESQETLSNQNEMMLYLNMAKEIAIK